MGAERLSRRLLRTFEWMLLATGIVCLTWYGGMMFLIDHLQVQSLAAVDRMLADPAVDSPVDRTPSDVPGDHSGTPGAYIGRLDIPRLNLSAAIVEGDDRGVLGFSVGHLVDTPPPWQAGNSALAAHRDRLFRPLKAIRIGDDISLATPRGAFRYRVRRTLVVNPEDVWVLDQAAGVNLTLITCYPFSVLGHAPQRFIVQAERLGQPTQ